MPMHHWHIAIGDTRKETKFTDGPVTPVTIKSILCVVQNLIR